MTDLVLPVIFAAVIVWLIVRIINRRETWAMTGLVALLVGCPFVVANIRPESAYLGHVSFDSSSPYFPGLSIIGDQYGWPWIYRIESFKTEAIRIDGFDEFLWMALLGNVAVAVVTVAAVSLLTWWIMNRLNRGFRHT